MQKLINSKSESSFVWNFAFLFFYSFGFVSSFGFRISDFLAFRVRLLGAKRMSRCHSAVRSGLG
jgi:hypothetical protein